MKRGTFVLTPFPFTDLTSNKVRPALVVSRSDRGGNDVILAFATSFKGQATIATDLLIDSSHPEFSMTGLKTASIIKLDWQRLISTFFSVNSANCRRRCFLRWTLSCATL